MKYDKFKKLYRRNINEVVPALNKASKVSILDSNSLRKEAYTISQCAYYVNTRTCNDCGTEHFKNFVRCKSKFCLNCNKVKSSMWTARLLQYIRQWLSMGKYVVFLNLTIKDTDSLAEGIKQLQGGWSNFTNSNSKYGKMFHSYFPGGFKAVEVVTGENSKQWHAHIHAICLKEQFSKEINFLHTAWPASVEKAGGYACNVQILPFKPYNKANSYTKEDYELQLVKSIKECCKYISKVNWLEESPERISELYTALSGKRQYSTWGVMYAVQEAVDADMNNKSDNDVEEFICQACGCTKFTKNSLFNAIWEDELILDYSNKMPDKLFSKERIQYIKYLNGKIPSAQQAPALYSQEVIQDNFITGTCEISNK